MYISLWATNIDPSGKQIYIPLGNQYMARALIRRAAPFFSVTVTQQQITKEAESNLVTINRVLTCF